MGLRKKERRKGLGLGSVGVEEGKVRRESWSLERKGGVKEEGRRKWLEEKGEREGGKRERKEGVEYGEEKS